MSRISPAPPERFAQVADHMERWKKTKGYPPNSWLAVIALLGWLNRWNVTLATRLEEEALAFAEKHLAPSGWTPGVHAHTISE
jgi:hypothetical protein